MPSLCLTCDAICCRHYTIPVTHLDIERIRVGTGRRLADFVAVERDDVAEQMPLAYLDGTPSQLVLARDPGTGACLFLDRHANRCSIHEHAPAICRMYPHELDPAPSGRLRRRHDVYCEGDFTLDEAEERQVYDTARRFWSRDIDAYRGLVQRWNFSGGAGDLGAFLVFVLRGL